MMMSNANLPEMAAALDGMAWTLDALLMHKQASDDFEAALTELAERAWATRMRRATFENQMTDLLGEYLRAAYVEGMEAGGADESDLDADDRRAIRNALREQKSYIAGLAEAVFAARRDEELRPAIEQRIGYWRRSIAAMRTIGQGSAKQREMVIWRLGRTEQHCQTCKQLNGQTHTRAWFARRNYVPQMPGAAMDCKGFQCLCRLEPAKKRSVRRYISRDVPNEPQPAMAPEGA